MHGHRKQDLMSLAYHREVARRLLRDANVRRSAIARLARWQRQGAIHRHYASRWSELLGLPDEELAGHLVRDDEDMQTLRQTSPFAGTLSPRERWALRRSVLESLEEEAGGGSPGASS